MKNLSLLEDALPDIAASLAAQMASAFKIFDTPTGEVEDVGVGEISVTVSWGGRVPFKATLTVSLEGV